MTYDHAGKYEVSVENSLGRERKFFSLAVEGKLIPLVFVCISQTIRLAETSRCALSSLRTRRVTRLGLDSIKLNYAESISDADRRLFSGNVILRFVRVIREREFRTRDTIHCVS